MCRGESPREKVESMGVDRSQMPEEGAGSLPSPSLPSSPKGTWGGRWSLGRGGGVRIKDHGGGVGIKDHGGTRNQTREEWGNGTRTISQRPQLSDSRLNSQTKHN